MFSTQYRSILLKYILIYLICRDLLTWCTSLVLLRSVGGEKRSKDDQTLSLDIKDPTEQSATQDKPASKMGKDKDTITILHFNDVYNIEPREQDPVGGAARFATALRSHNQDNPLVLFSGDAFNPSLMSSITKGKQMVPVLNAMNIQCACYGNHDFDFGVDVLSKMASQCNFPWLLANVYDNLSEKILADGIPSKMIEWQGKKIGLVGLVEEEWIATLATVDADDITFIDYVTEGRRLAKQLREEGADYVIALTHMRWPNDRRLARNVEEIDLVLGGHDHDYNIEQVDGKWVIKSGTDFREYSKIKLNFQNKNKVDVQIEKCIVDSSIQEDKELKEVVDKYVAIMGEKMENVIGYMEVELDGRFSSVRTKETNLGNFVTDIMLEAVNADLALLNSGTLRSDTVHPKGPFKMKDLCSILPMVDPLVVLKLTGRQVLNALENSVSQYPSLEGRFPQTAGVKFAFDPTKPAGNRIDPRYVRIQGEYMVLDNFYRLVTKHYLAEGKDGYDVFKEGQVLVNDEEGPRLSIIVQNHFKAVQIVKGNKVAKTPHRQSLISINRRRSLVKQMTLPDDNNVRSSTSPIASPTSPTGVSVTSLSEPSLGSTDSLGKESSPCPSEGHQAPRRAHPRGAMLVRRASIQSIEMDHMPGALAPTVDGRIVVLDDSNRHDFEQERVAWETAAMTIQEGSESAPPTPVIQMNKPSFTT